MLGVSRQLVSDWFAGRKTATLDSGLKIQTFLKIRICKKVWPGAKYSLSRNRL
jgi:predicted transcriptional regulator